MLKNVIVAEVYFSFLSKPFLVTFDNLVKSNDDVSQPILPL